MHKCVFFVHFQLKGVCENFMAVLSKCTCTVQSNILRKSSSLNICFFLLSGKLNEIFLCLLAKQTKPSCQKFVLSVKKILFLLEKLKFAQMFSFCVPTAKKNLQKLFGGLLETVLALSTLTIWGKLILWKFVFFLSLGNWRIFFCPMAKET